MIGKADATNEDDHMAAARQVIAYRSLSNKDKVEDLANAMLAYVKLYQIHGVKVP